MNTIQSKNTHKILSELLESLQLAGDATDIYFDHVNDGEIFIGKNEALPPEFFYGFGIRRLISDTSHGRLSLSEKDFVGYVERDAPSLRWRGLRSDLIMEDLKMLFENSQVVEFENWSDVNNASDIWDNLRRDIIKPLRKRDFDFVFYLGDAVDKLGFEVDEFLDIVCDYSGYGRVTLVLDERNVDNLRAMFFGKDAHFEISILPGLPEKCRSVFDLVNIEHMIVDSYPDVQFFSKQRHFEIEDRRGFDISKTGRRRFNTGYILGLLLKVDISHSVALGLAVAGIYSENESKPDGKLLICYIEKWIGEIESLKPMESQLVVA